MNNINNNKFNEVKGIENPANNCYLNAILQLLYSCPEFLKIIQQNKAIDISTLSRVRIMFRYKDDNSLIKFMKDFIRLYSLKNNNKIDKNNRQYLNNNIITSAFTKTFPKNIFHGISSSGQEDAGEILIQILQILNTKYNNIILNLFYPKKGTIVFNEKGLIKPLIINQDDFDTFKIPIYDEFEINEYYNKYKKNHTIKEKLNINLQKLINNYFEIKIKPKKYRIPLNGSNNFIPVADQIYLYGNMPQYAIITLNRFANIQISKNEFATFKINSELNGINGIIQIPFYINNISSNENFKIPEKKIQSYELSGFLVHIGDNITGGHYIAYFKRNVSGKDKWYSFDDAKVNEINEEDNIKNQFNSAYIFLYQKINTPQNNLLNELGSNLITQKLKSYNNKTKEISELVENHVISKSQNLNSNEQSLQVISKPSINEQSNSIKTKNINNINNLIKKIQNKNNKALEELKRKIEQLLQNSSLENIFLIKHIIHNILKKTSTTNKSISSWFMPIFVLFSKRKNRLNSDLIEYIIQQYKEHQNENTTSLYPIEIDLLIELFLTNDPKLKEMKNLLKLSIYLH